MRFAYAWYHVWGGRLWVKFDYDDFFGARFGHLGGWALAWPPVFAILVCPGVIGGRGFVSDFGSALLFWHVAARL